MPIRNQFVLIAATIVCIACAFQARRYQYAGKVGFAMQLIEDNYIDEVKTQELMNGAMEGLTKNLDENSAYIPPQKYEQFNILIEQTFGGIGIQVEGPPRVPRLTVVAPMPGTPAFKAGIQAGDTILEINKRPTDPMSLEEAMKEMKGPPGTSVELLVQRMDSSEQDRMVLVRDKIEIDSVVGDQIQADSTWNYFLPEDPRIAYIRVSVFGDRTEDEFFRALDAIRKDARALVIDLRYNPGGILDSAVALCDALVDQGVIVKTKGRRIFFDREFKAEPDLRLDKSVPIVVMVNGESASASEIMAGCLQDLGRAKIAGSRSYGKGTVQQVFEIQSARSALKFTTARFLRPSDKNIHRTQAMTDNDEWGILPEQELTLPMTDLQQVYLNRRWYDRGDPRLAKRSDRPPEPRFAGDPQLALAVDSLQRQLESKP